MYCNTKLAAEFKAKKNKMDSFIDYIEEEIEGDNEEEQLTPEAASLNNGN